MNGDTVLHGIDYQNLSGDFDEADGKHLAFWTDKQLSGVLIRDVAQIVRFKRLLEFLNSHSMQKELST